MANVTPVVICLSASGVATARKVSTTVGATLHGRAGRVTGADVEYDEATAHIAALFTAGTPIVGVCAAGILIRAVAPLLSDKRAEPPVLAVSEDGASVVPLLGGHRGANAMARDLAAALGAQAHVTTAGDLAFGLALDEPPEGWRLQNAADCKSVSATLLSGGGATVVGLDWAADLPKGEDVRLIGTRAPVSGDAGTLVYHPQVLTLGVGCARNCPPEELASLIDATLAEANLAPGAVAAVGSIDLKGDEPAVIEAAWRLDVPLRLFDAAALEAEAPRLANPSGVVFAEVGCHGVAEGAALALAGAEAALLVEKKKTANATVAVARAPNPITQMRGRKRGKVSLVGIGPGQADWRTPEASKLVTQADELVGYGLYLELLGPLARHKPQRDFPLGGEEARCRYALERAGEGVDVALICSGDAGIYAMGALVFELLDRPEGEGGVTDAARRVEVASAPGVSALQAAAARAGAPLGHDFCAISLSDLLTPREDILRRIRAAAEGDFVIAFYNPVSKRRRTLLAEARDTLLAHLPADCPVLLASNLGRTEERLAYRRLDELQVDEVDMLTVVLVGSSQSRLAQLGEGPRMFTPRGYAKRIDSPKAAGEGS